MTKRIEEILKRIPTCETLLDVGCDHGIVSYEALRRGIAKHVICSDVSALSLEKAKNLIGENGTYYVADGIPCPQSDFDFLVIAGMGGQEIMKILRGKLPCNALFQPMKNIDELRSFLVSNGYKIESDEIIEDGKFYNIIVASKGSDCLSEDEKTFGRTNLKNRSEDFMKYLASEEQKTKRILNSVSDKRKAELTSYLERLEKIKNDD